MPLIFKRTEYKRVQKKVFEMDKPIAKNDDELRYCVSCKLFLRSDLFKTGGRRLLCRKHYNMELYQVKKARWVEDPQKKQAVCVWQLALIDSKKTFKQKMEISIHQISKLLTIHKIDPCQPVRLAPVDPEKALSFQNCILVSQNTKKGLCYLWKNLHCRSRYIDLLQTMSPAECMLVNQNQKNDHSGSTLP